MSETGDLENITNFQELVPFLQDELSWPIEEKSGSYDPEFFDDITFEYDPTELGLKPDQTARIRELRQLRPLATGQPWGIFFVSFDDKKVPVSVLKRILGGLVIKRRKRAKDAGRAGWIMHDLLFISNFGKSGERELSFLHFSDDDEGTGKPILRELGWDKKDPFLKRQYVYGQLKKCLVFPDDPNAADEWRKQWTSAFTVRYGETISTTKQLTKTLAELASNIREAANEVLEHEGKTGPLTQIFENFKQALFHHLTPDDFADMYAQTICYGLLAARISRESGALVADDAALMAPLSHPFLKELMETFLAVGGRKRRIDFNELGVNEVVETLRNTNMEAVLRDFDNRNPNEDPVLHFYEHFLRDYDGIKREQRGVYYTPKPVVSFIVRSADEVLQKDFGLADGLADTTTWEELIKRKPEISLPEGVSPDEPFVKILDPAVGTGTFLVEVIELIEDRMKSKWRRDGNTESLVRTLWNEYVREHLLPRLYGFELLMAAYAICHIKIGLELHKTGFQASDGDRVRVYLTNTLEEPVEPSSQFKFMSDALAIEARSANVAKRETPITVIVGNPPYSGHSQNASRNSDGSRTWIGALIQPYFSVDGQPLGEKNPKWLHDDYVKFIRYAQWRLDRLGVGVFGYISNHSYLDNPTFRGMRQSLLQTYGHIWILDLHGSTKKKETAPDGSKDENVFNIQQGVAIFVGSRINRSDHDVQKGDLFGLRESSTGGGKFPWLLANTAFSVSSSKLLPQKPFYMLVSRDESLHHEYHAWPSLPELMPVNVLGFQTHRDHFAIAIDPVTIADRIADLRNDRISNQQLREKYELKDNRDWQLKSARGIVKDDRHWREKIIQCAYRPFDNRHCYFNYVAMDYPRRELLDHVAWRENISILASRQQNTAGFRHAWIANVPAESCAVSNATREGNYVFPLRIYPRTELEKEIRANFNEEVVSRISELLKLEYVQSIEFGQRKSKSHDELEKREHGGKPTNRGRGNLTEVFGPRDLFDYIYATLHSPSYRERYVDFLKSDFARIPLPENREVFMALVQHGRHLVALHLLDESEAHFLKKPQVRLAGSGDADVEIGYPRYENGRVFINSTRWFEDVPQKVWEFSVGSYQVCEKWLKDRANKGGNKPRLGLTLTKDDVRHYCKIIAAIGETIRLIDEIDRTINKHGGWPGAFYVPPPPPPTIEEIIEADEGQEVEYKSTFQWNSGEKKKDGEIRKAALKTIVAFLNSGGGTLVIGVNDDKKILGLEGDLSQTRNDKDWLQQTIVNFLNETVGPEFAPCYGIRFGDTGGGKEVCVIEVEKKGPKAAFLDIGNESEFFVRTGNKTVQLKGREMMDYIRAHWRD